jgi:hypothetical protein
MNFRLNRNIVMRQLDSPLFRRHGLARDDEDYGRSQTLMLLKFTRHIAGTITTYNADSDDGRTDALMRGQCIT